MLPREDIRDWLALNAVEGIGPRTTRLLLERLGTPGAALRATRAELEASGLRREVIDNLQAGNWFERADTELSQATELGLELLTIADEAYPALLKEIYDPPPVLYCKGDLAGALTQPCIAMVGSRHCSTYGRNAADMLARDVAARGVTIVSGLARGIDTAAHEGALAVGGKTVAVLGTGLDQIYPKENDKLVERICQQGGAILSELSLNTAPTPKNFPYRNRIISGLSYGVVVVEAAERSGSLITARLAYEQGREVFAVPGNISSRKSFGPNYLIKDGAKLVQTAQDILEELPREQRQTLSAEAPAATQFGLNFAPPDLTAPETQVLELLSLDEPLHIDQLMLQGGIAAPELFNVLLMLEMKDCIRQLPGKKFVKTVASGKS